MNCHGGAFVRGLKSIPGFSDEFDLERFITLSTINLPALPDEMRKTIAGADLLIYNPVSTKYGFASSDAILQLTKPDCLKVSVPYYRFHGFWDRTDAEQLVALRQVNGCGIFVNRSCLDGTASYAENWALDTPARRERAIAVFNESLAKFKDIDQTSNDVSMYEFFNETYRDAPLFPNHLHPSIEFMDELVSQTAAAFGMSGRANTGRGLDKYSWPVQPAVAEALGLRKTPKPKILDEEFSLEKYLRIAGTLAELTEPVGDAHALQAYIAEKIS